MIPGIKHLDQKLNKYSNSKLVLVLLLLAGCTTAPQIETTVDEGISILENETIEKLKTSHIFVSGRGNFSATGNYSAKLNFIYEAWKDSAEMTFTDILGRRILQVKAGTGTFEVKDILKNRVMNETDILVSYPVFSWLDSEKLINALWGIAPEINEEILGDHFKNSRIEFENEQFSNGLLLSAFTVFLNSEEDKIRFEFLSRNFKSLNIDNDITLERAKN